RAAASPSTIGTLSPEPRAYRKQIRPATEIVLRASERRRQIRLRLLVANLESGRHRIAREANPAHSDRPRRRSRRRVRVVEDRIGARVDELSRLRVAPVDHAESAAEIRLEPAILSERQ